MLMLIADGVVADDVNAYCWRRCCWWWQCWLGWWQCWLRWWQCLLADNGLQEFLPLLTWISVCPGEIVHNLLCLNIRDNTAYILQHLHFPLLIKIRIDLFSSNPTSRSSLPRATPPQGRWAPRRRTRLTRKRRHFPLSIWLSLITFTVHFLRFTLTFTIQLHFFQEVLFTAAPDLTTLTRHSPRAKSPVLRLFSLESR